jgi:predicted Zn-dependent protease
LFGGSWSASIASQIGRQMIDAKFSRDKEFEADHYGVIYARKAGFDPTQSVAFFDRLRTQEKTQPGLTRAFENHPNTPARITAVCSELSGMGYNVGCPAAPAPAARPASPAPAGSSAASPANTPSLVTPQEHN